MKKSICLLLSLLLLSSCKSYETTNKSFDSSKEIVIFYSNNPSNSVKDVKENELKNTPNVTLVNVGDNSNIELMNSIGYDYSCFGLKDFDNGLEALYEKTCEANFKYLLCSASYNGQTKDYFKKTAPYEVVDYDGIKIGYVGVLSPRYVETSPNNFKENGNIVVNFYNETEEVFYDTVECSIEKAKDKGVDYIILLSNFDDDEKYSPYTLEELLANLSYVDVVINENDYSEIGETHFKDKDSKDVLIVSNGLNKDISGKIVIKNGYISNHSFD